MDTVVRPRKPLGARPWFKVLLTLLLFLPAYTSQPFDPVQTGQVVKAVLSAPWLNSVRWLLPLAKLVLVGAVVLPLLLKRSLSKSLVIYYGVVLIPVSLFQNMAVTSEYGYAWLVGNTLVQLIVAAYILYAIRCVDETNSVGLLRKRIWLVAPMFVAFLMPYAISAQGVIVPELSLSVLTNEAGVTYCMITPVVLGMLLLYSQDGIQHVFSVIAYVGLLYGMLNMLTWFVLDAQQWWMGVLHLPLLIISAYGLFVSKKGETS